MKRLSKRLGIFIENKHLLIIVVSLALIVPSIFGAMLVKMESGKDTIISNDSQVYKDLERFDQHFSEDVITILLSGNELTRLLQLGNVASMETLENQMSGNQQVVSVIGPAFLIKQAVAQQTGVPELPDDVAQFEAIVVDPENGEIRTEFRQVFPDNEHALIAVTLDGNLSQNEQVDIIVEVEETINIAGFEGIEVTVTGEPVFRKWMTDSMNNSMLNMLVLSTGIMLLVLALTFSVRGFFVWRWLPLGAVLIAIIYTFGAMGVLSIPITLVTMAAFPILIGLGVDYAIQLHNRHDEEVRRGKTAAAVFMGSVAHVGPAIGIAVIATCLGFAALFFSPVPMVQSFGLTLIIGIIAAYLLSMFAVLSILYWRDRRSKPSAESDNRNRKPEKERVHILDKGLRRLAPWVIKNLAIIFPIALLMCVGGIIADFHIEAESDQMKYCRQDAPALKDLQTAESVLGGVRSISLFMEAEDVTDPAILAWMLQLEQHIDETHSDVVANNSNIAGLVMQYSGGTIPQDHQVIEDILEAVPVPIKRNLITDDHTAANMVLTLPESPLVQLEELKEQLIGYTDSRPDGLEVTVTGIYILSIEFHNALTGGRLEMTVIGSALVLMCLFLLFKFNVIRALIAVLPIALILGWSSGVMYLFGIKQTPLTATLGALIIGIGVEFTILLMMRYYEERGKGEGVTEAMTTAITSIGRAIIASGVTTMGGFGALLIARDFPAIQEFGIVTLINVFFALVSTLLVLPTLIILVDRWRERPKDQKVAKSAFHHEIDTGE